MRDPERIDRMSELLREAWQLVPDFRLTQLVMVISGHPEDGGSVFYDEDDSMERKIRSFIAAARKRAKGSQTK